MELSAEYRCFGGWQRIFKVDSASTGVPMQFSVYLPPQVRDGKVPVLWYLSGLTCTWENATTKAGFQRAAAEHGVMVVCPDTSPRGEGVPDDEAWDFGQGAGFYVDAKEAPWSEHFKMWSYVTEDLPTFLFAAFPARQDAQGITGHSMGGHGALTIGLTYPERFQSVSALAPIVNPSVVPWGTKALGGYLGDDKAAWAKHDATELVKAGRRCSEILIDQGDDDDWLEEQLQPERFQAACEEAGQPLELRMQKGYDHSYYFVSSFIADHIERLARATS
jgi:S-formylglutathione hydrolase